MPYSIEIALSIERSLRLPPNLAIALHGAAFRWLDMMGAAQTYHDDTGAQPKPFTVSPLVRGGTSASFRLTLLDDSLYEGLRCAIEQRPFVEVPHGTRMAQLPIASDPEVTHRSYATLVQGARTGRHVILSFESPTSFHKDGMDLPLPDAEHVFASHRRTWNAFVSAELAVPDEWIDWVRCSVAITEHRLWTEEFHLPGHDHVGCMGVVHYRVPDKVSALPSDLARLNVLADYAFFCGTGRRTTHGMGQTRRLEQWRGDSPRERG
jgi:CRISPR-associated endoribonuclease Cas6